MVTMWQQPWQLQLVWFYRVYHDEMINDDYNDLVMINHGDN